MEQQLNKHHWKTDRHRDRPDRSHLNVSDREGSKQYRAHSDHERAEQLYLLSQLFSRQRSGCTLVDSVV